MKKLLLLLICASIFFSCQKETIEVAPVSDFDHLKTVSKLKDQKGFLMDAGNNLTVIVVEGNTDNFDPLSCVANPSERYVVGNLPSELKNKTDLKIVFSGEVKELLSATAPNLGIPLKLTKIRVK
ncbi:hypothetical protein GCM10011514_33030 [Emticicia aquatilis]|uniref:Lipoprotein n=1 Tax=Emticicia aquatilis TaxID=1537369 RepID=A0A917DT66_9BACT|nr:hypothetical protein [Emticicia aquatilis]GGD66435.1 hypothetical protein GCM10011514_33030 [Emticicia aquatilis]